MKNKDLPMFELNGVEVRRCEWNRTKETIRVLGFTGVGFRVWGIWGWGELQSITWGCLVLGAELAPPFGDGASGLWV